LRSATRRLARFSTSSFTFDLEIRTHAPTKYSNTSNTINSQPIDWNCCGLIPMSLAQTLQKEVKFRANFSKWIIDKRYDDVTDLAYSP
jgi:hypothetical protein